MTAVATAVRGRPVTLSREGDVYRLAFNYNADLVKRAKTLPYSAFDPATKSWTTRVCAQTVQQLRRWWHEGLLDVGPDDLLHPGEDPSPAAEAVLRAGTGKRPYYVHMATRDSSLFPALRAVPGALWEKKASALSFPPSAAPALADLVDRGTLDDPEDLLRAAGVTVAFDGRTGTFAVRGDARAAAAFNGAFPAVDVVAQWKTKNLDVDFLDTYTEQMYRGELARVSEGLQPDGMRIDLMPHQRQTVAIAVERPGFAVFDEPGVGKTSQAIATGLELLNRGEISRVVAVVPAAVRTQWANEILKFTYDTPSDIVVVRGDRNKRAAAYEAAEEARWFIVHYDVLARDEADLKTLFAGAFVIADEAHRVKNHTASRTKALRALAKSARRRMGLTGTPVETHPGEWYEVLSGFSVPDCLGSPFEFNERYRWKARFGGYEGSKNLGELRVRSNPFYVRRTKAEVVPHLPPLHVATMALDPSPAYAGMLRRAHADAAEEIRTANLASRTAGKLGAGEAVGDADFAMIDASLFEEVKDGADMTATGQLRLLCSSPRLINVESASGKAMLDAGLVADEDGPKMDEIRTITAELLAAQQRRKEKMVEEGRETPTAAEVTGERIVLFTFSKRMANLISERLTEDGVPHVMFTGDTGADARDDAVAAFQNPTSDVIAFVATDAAAEGLNLGACCSTLINVDLPWTPARLAQRSQRIHRLDGKDAHYQVTNLIVAGTMEHGILKLLEARSDMADTLFGSAGGKNKVLGNRVSFAARALEEYANEHEKDLKKVRTVRARTADDPQLTASGQRPNDRADAGEATEPGGPNAGPDASLQLTLL